MFLRPSQLSANHRLPQLTFKFPNPPLLFEHGVVFFFPFLGLSLVSFNGFPLPSINENINLITSRLSPPPCGTFCHDHASTFIGWVSEASRLPEPLIGGVAH